MSVYLFECFAFFQGFHLVKIGFSKCEFTNEEISDRKKIEKRFRSLQTGMGIPIFLRAMKKGTLQDEKKLHEKYREFCHISELWIQDCEDLYHGKEWFLLSKNKYQNLLKEYTKNYSIPKTFERCKFSSTGENPKDIKNLQEKIIFLQNENFDLKEKLSEIENDLFAYEEENERQREKIRQLQKEIRKLKSRS